VRNGEAMPMDAKEFYDGWRTKVVRYMTLVDTLRDRSDLYYWGGPGLTIWVVVGPHSVVVAYSAGDSRAEIRERVKIWHQALSNGVFPDRSQSIGNPVYGASDNRDDGSPTVVWFQLGDWARVYHEALSHHCLLTRCSGNCFRMVGLRATVCKLENFL